MISLSAMEAVAGARLKDAEVLLASRRLDGAVYLCGYAVEIALKVRVCKTLKWTEFPLSASEFKRLKLKSFMTHDLDTLLRLSGIEQEIKTSLMVEWSIVTRWDPQVRYKPIGRAKQQDADEMIASSNKLLEVLL